MIASSQKATAGSFVLYYEGYATTSILYDASEEDVEVALSTISIIQGVDVDFSLGYSGACSSTAINIIQASNSHRNTNMLRQMPGREDLPAVGSINKL